MIHEKLGGRLRAPYAKNLQSPSIRQNNEFHVKISEKPEEIKALKLALNTYAKGKD